MNPACSVSAAHGWCDLFLPILFLYLHPGQTPLDGFVDEHGNPFPPNETVTAMAEEKEEQERNRNSTSDDRPWMWIGLGLLGASLGLWACWSFLGFCCWCCRRGNRSTKTEKAAQKLPSQVDVSMDWILEHNVLPSTPPTKSRDPSLKMKSKSLQCPNSSSTKCDLRTVSGPAPSTQRPSVPHSLRSVVFALHSFECQFLGLRHPHLLTFLGFHS